MFEMTRKESIVLMAISADPDSVYSDIASVNYIFNLSVSSHLVFNINIIVFSIQSTLFNTGIEGSTETVLIRKK